MSIVDFWGVLLQSRVISIIVLRVVAFVAQQATGSRNCKNDILEFCVMTSNHPFETQ